MRTKFTAALAALAALAAVTLGPVPAAQAATGTSTVYLSPKIWHYVSTVPEPAANAASVGEANMSPYVSGRQMSIEYRPVNSGQAWQVLQTGYPSSGGWMKFRAWAQYEYRSHLHAYGTWTDYYSPVRQYTWAQRADMSDEFTWDGTNTLDPTKWFHRDGHDNAFTHGDPRAVSVNGDVAKIKLIDNPAYTGDPGTHGTDLVPSHLNGHVATYGTVQGNYWMAARVKFHPRGGAHAGVWSQAGYQYGGGEIDFAEYFADQRFDASSRNLHQTAYLDDNPNDGWNRRATSWDQNVDGKRWWDSYHTFAYRYSGTGIQFWIDGVKVDQFTWTHASDKPATLIMSMLSSYYTTTGTWEYQQDNAFEPAYISGYAMLVDWVATWQ